MHLGCFAYCYSQQNATAWKGHMCARHTHTNPQINIMHTRYAHVYVYMKREKNFSCDHASGFVNAE